MTDSTGPILLRSAGAGLVVDASGPGLPAVLHWGPDLGAHVPPPRAWTPALAHSAPDVVPQLTLLAGGAAGGAHRPALTGGPAWQPSWRLGSRPPPGAALGPARPARPAGPGAP